MKSWLFVSGLAKNLMGIDGAIKPEFPVDLLKYFPDDRLPSSIPGIYLTAIGKTVKNKGKMYKLEWSCHHQLTDVELDTLVEDEHGERYFNGFKVTKNGYIRKCYTILSHGWQGAFTKTVKDRARMLGIDYIWDDPIVPDISDCIAWLYNEKNIDPMSIVQ